LQWCASFHSVVRADMLPWARWHRSTAAGNQLPLKATRRRRCGRHCSKPCPKPPTSGKCHFVSGVDRPAISSSSGTLCSLGEGRGYPLRVANSLRPIEGQGLRMRIQTRTAPLAMVRALGSRQAGTFACINGQAGWHVGGARHREDSCVRHDPGLAPRKRSRQMDTSVYRNSAEPVSNSSKRGRLPPRAATVPIRRVGDRPEAHSSCYVTKQATWYRLFA
jgi:hypothetical protein